MAMFFFVICSIKKYSRMWQISIVELYEKNYS